MTEHTERLATDIPEQAERILIVDDDPSMRTALMESVRRLGFDVQGANDGADAVERVGRYKPWLVVTDLKMPRLGGLDLIKEIKSRSPHTLMVLMTAYGTVETAVEAMKYGASDYLLKPFSTDLLERVIANLKARGTDASTPSPAPIDQRSILTQDPGHGPPAQHRGGSRLEPSDGPHQWRKRYRERIAGPFHP